MDNSFSIRGGLEDRTLVFEGGAKRGVVDEIAVVGDGELAEAVGGAQGLDVLELRGSAGGGVTDMADGGGAGEGEEGTGIVEDLRHETEAGQIADGGEIGGGDAGAFLTTVLKGVEGNGAEPGGFRVAGDAHDTALLAWFL